MAFTRWGKDRTAKVEEISAGVEDEAVRGVKQADSFFVSGVTRQLGVWGQAGG